MKSVAYIITRVLLFLIFLALVVVIVALARGYRFNVEDGTLTSTGIISANSLPTGAKIFINDNLAGVTNTNITLSPGKYTIRISKEGFTEWKKEVTNESRTNIT